MEEYMVQAHAIVFGQLDGNKFNWNTMSWEKRE